MKSFDEWQKSAFLGELHGGLSIAKITWDAALEQAALFVAKNVPYQQGIGSIGIAMADEIRKHKAVPEW